MKKCFKCNIEKPLSEFYKHPRMLDGHVNKCKECNKKDIKINYENNKLDIQYVVKERKRGRQKYHRLYRGTGKANQERNFRYLERFPEKKKASSLSASIKAPFEGAERHHWSYNIEHAKNVIFLSKKDHMKAHRFITYDSERFMYRRFDTNELLDTYERHLDFIEYCIKNYED